MDSKYRFSADDSEIDRVKVHHWLSEESYWAKGRTRTMQDQAMDGSKNFGVYETVSGHQVAYARVVTDGVTFAWLCDVFVTSDVRGQGIGVALLEGIIEAFEPLNMKRMLLSTADAHGLYSKFGFEPLDTPAQWMQRVVNT